MAVGLIAAGVGFCLLFGCVYDRAVARWAAQGYDEGYTALLVVGGVWVTLLGAIPICWGVLLWLAKAQPWAQALGVFAGQWAAFGASGCWMVLGSVARYARRRRRGQERWLEVLQ